MSEVRLNKLLSQCGVSSRRAADELILQGRVELNGRIVTELGTKADPARDDVRVDGRRLKTGGERRYLLMYKPAGVVSTRSDPQGRKTVIDLLTVAGISGYFYPVGRLDYDSEGLILLTNDGDFAERVTHPRYEIARTYEARVLGVPDERDLDRLRHGVIIDGHRTLPASVRVLRLVESRDGPQAVIEITVREGRNRQVRAMCDAIAHPVERLRRTRIGPISDRVIKPGQIRDLTPAEVGRLMGPDDKDGSRLGARGSGTRKPHSGHDAQKRSGAPSSSHAPRAFFNPSRREGSSRSGRGPSRRGPRR